MFFFSVSVDFSFFFNDTATTEIYTLSLHDALPISAAQALTFETLAPTDWVDKSREDLAPVEAGRFVVHGAHARERARINRIAVEIDAGLAFGTGHHGTTRGCLLALDRIIKQRRHRPTKSSFRSSPRKRGPRASVCGPWTPA